MLATNSSGQLLFTLSPGKGFSCAAACVSAAKLSGAPLGASSILPLLIQLSKASISSGALVLNSFQMALVTLPPGPGGGMTGHSWSFTVTK